MIRTKTGEEILSEALAYLQQHTDITFLAPGGAARGLVESFAIQLAGLYRALDTAMVNAYPSTASGPFLDLIGELVGVRRGVKESARTSASDRNVRLYVTAGTLGDLIGKPGDATKALVPDGTTLENSDGTVVFVVDGNHEVPAGATEVYVTAYAQTVGASGSVGPGKLVRSSLPAGVLVENVEQIVTGSEVEGDDELRLRIRNAVRSAEGANAAA